MKLLTGLLLLRTAALFAEPQRPGGKVVIAPGTIQAVLHHYRDTDTRAFGAALTGTAST